MSGTVLIIENDTRIANWLKVYLGRAGFSAEVAHDGESGLALARHLIPDLIILDLMLPRLDGVELCRILRRTSDVPIIMLTAREAHAERIMDWTVELTITSSSPSIQRRSLRAPPRASSGRRQSSADSDTRQHHTG